MSRAPWPAPTLAFGRCAAAMLLWLAVHVPTAAAAPGASVVDASPWLERLDRGLAYETAGGLLRTELSGLVDVEGYYIDEHAPGLIYGGATSFVNPRLTLFLDTHVGRRLYSLVQLRVDRGFDPRSRTVSARFDEYLLRYTPFDAPWVSLQVGKFATVIGNWVARHDSWHNPFVNAPLPYENVVTITDGKAPASRSQFLGRRNLADKKREWVPIVWGPSYTTGAAVFGRAGSVDYALEVKNGAPSARPPVWDARSRGFGAPTVNGRLGWLPSAPWKLGASFGVGPYLRERAAPTLPAGRDPDDFDQYLVGVDASWSWRHLEVWAEWFASRFEVPVVGDAETVAYYLETRYRLTAALFVALRWNQQFFGNVEDDAGRQRPWDRDVWRLDTALGWRFDRHLQMKLQYAYRHQRGGVQQGEQLVAAQLTLRF